MCTTPQRGHGTPKPPGSPTFSHESTPTKAITTFQAPSVDRLNRHFVLPFGDHDSPIAITLGTGALEILCPFNPVAAPAIHPPRSAQPPAQTIPPVLSCSR